MTLTADLHLHSHHSNSTSPAMDLPTLSHAAARKGIDLLGTGDCTHPAWLQELQAQLKDLGNGLYTYNGSCFLITGEISLVWRQEGRGRRVHLVLLVPCLDDAMRIHDALSLRGNLAYDGRPMLGLSARDLCEIVWERSPETVLIPAHLWTPWYSVLGSKSGFDSLEACFGSYASQIIAVETGLSSDPPMNRRVSALDRLQLISCSDAHSPAKLAREATLFDLPDLSFHAVAHALRTGEGHAGTLEFYPEQGKYHYDGHRSCGVSQSPSQSAATGDRCPVCDRPLTLGVLHRVQALADRAEPAMDGTVYRSLVPLDEILSQVLGVGVQSKAVARLYEAMLDRHGTELSILLDYPLDRFGPEIPDGVVEGIDRMRRGELRIEPGYDGVYGRVSLGGCQT
jgi:DNA helicase II / ATP-dependent DNA helicase PcrA